MWSSNRVIAFVVRSTTAPTNVIIRSTTARASQNVVRPFVSKTTALRVSIAEEEELLSGYKRPTVNWYPGHIAKAERQLSETLKAVDVVVEVRDARACKATSHEKVAEWCAGRPRIVVLTHVDLIPKLSIVSWKRSYEEFGAGKWDGEVNTQVVNQAIQNQQERTKHTAALTKKKQGEAISQVENVLFVDAKSGQGVHALHRAIFKAGSHVQERRAKRGLKDRALRVGIIGYPNVGKSALINRILGRKRAKTANKPGVTRTLQWIRVRSDDSKTSRRRDFELLDSPGVIPAKMIDQSDAVLLAACNCIGDASYDNQSVAAYLFEWLKSLHQMGKGDVTAPVWPQKCQERYGFNPIGRDVELTGEDMVFKIADDLCRGNAEDASRKMLQDFRTGRLGLVCLQLAPQSEEDNGQLKVRLPSDRVNTKDQVSWEDDRIARAEAAIATAQKQGLELPPMIQEQNEGKDDGEKEVGKGLFEGW